MTQLLPLEPYLEQVRLIENSVHSHPWSTSLLAKPEGQFDCHRVLVNENDDVIGYFYAQCVAGEASLLNIAIAPHFQGQGYGKQLLQHFFAQMQARAASEAWLEVRASNINAIKLYESAGFNEYDRRFGYYPSDKGREDALVMSYWFA